MGGDGYPAGLMLIWWTLVFLAIFLIGVTKSGFGAGVGLMIVPMMAIAMGHIPGRGSEAALGLMLPLLVLGDLIAVWQYRDLFRKRLVPIPVATAVTVGAENNPSAEANPTEDRAPADAPSPIGVVKRLLPATAVGVVLGGLMLWWFHQQTAIVGALINRLLANPVLSCVKIGSMRYPTRLHEGGARASPRPTFSARSCWASIRRFWASLISWSNAKPVRPGHRPRLTHRSPHRFGTACGTSVFSKD